MKWEETSQKGKQVFKCFWFFGIAAALVGELQSTLSNPEATEKLLVGCILILAAALNLMEGYKTLKALLTHNVVVEILRFPPEAELVVKKLCVQWSVHPTPAIHKAVWEEVDKIFPGKVLSRDRWIISYRYINADIADLHLERRV